MSCFGEAIQLFLRETGLHYLDPKYHDAARNVREKSVCIF